jgi:hypothetical protein
MNAVTGLFAELTQIVEIALSYMVRDMFVILQEDVNNFVEIVKSIQVKNATMEIIMMVMDAQVHVLLNQDGTVLESQVIV